MTPIAHYLGVQAKQIKHKAFILQTHDSQKPHIKFLIRLHPTN